jgi:hypothetical protein
MALMFSLFIFTIMIVLEGLFTKNIFQVGYGLLLFIGNLIAWARGYYTKICNIFFNENI